MQHAFILGLIGVAMLLFAFEVVRPDVVAIGVLLALLLTGTLEIQEGFAGFSSPAVITVIAMFILSAALVRTGVADSLALQIVRIGGKSPARLTLAVMLTVGALSAFMNNIGAVAVLLPAVFIVANRTGYPVTKLLIPLSFGSLLGGLSTLIGTPPNLIVSMALEERGYAGFLLFDFLPTGAAVLGAAALYMVFIGRHLIPVRKAGSLTREYEMQAYLSELIVPPGSPLAGRTIATSRIRPEFELTVLRIRRRGAPADEAFVPQPDTPLRVGDRLVVEGNLALLLQREDPPLAIYARQKFTDEGLVGEGVQLAEVAIAPNARILGRSIEQGYIRRRYGVLVLALRRRQETLQERFISVPLEVGDVLLVQGTPEALRELNRSPDFLVVNRLTGATRHPRRAPVAIGIMALVIGLAATGVLHISVAGLLGVLLMVTTGCVRARDMYFEVEWRVIFLIACMIPLGTAMDENHTGTARWLADHIVGWSGAYGPYAVLAAVILITTLITEVMSNAAAAVLLAPIGIAIAEGLGLMPHPFLMGIAIGASTTFLTPIGHQANVLVYGVGNYRFADFPRTGALLNLVIFAVAMLVIPLVWPFTPLPAR